MWSGYGVAACGFDPDRLVGFTLGGCFLIVPGLVGATRMPMLNAVGTSLVAVAAFGLTTALNYALSGLVNWPLAGVFIAGGIVGGLLGMVAARRLSERRGGLTTVFATLVFAVAGFMLWRSASAFYQWSPTDHRFTLAAYVA